MEYKFMRSVLDCDSALQNVATQLVVLFIAIDDFI